MLVKVIIVIFLLVILYSLGSALYYLVCDHNDTRTIKALTWRITLSFILFILLFIAYALGWIHPHQV